MITTSYIPNVNLNRENRMEPVRVSSIPNTVQRLDCLFLGKFVRMYIHTGRIKHAMQGQDTRGLGDLNAGGKPMSSAPCARVVDSQSASS